MSRVVIREPRPLRAGLLVAAMMAVSVVLTASYFVSEHIELRAMITSLRGETVRQRAALARKDAKILSLTQEATGHARARQVEARAYREVENNLVGFQNEILGLEEEVAFYRGIVSSSKQGGVRVRKLFLFPGDAAHKFRFQVLLTRYMKDDKVLQGSLSLTVAGEEKGQAHSIPAERLLGGGELEFSFKYFHRVEGQLNLPPEFVPRRVHVRVKAPGETPASAEKAFDWDVTTG